MKSSSEEYIVQSLAHGGECVAIAAEDSGESGKKCFIRDVIPGERVSATLTEEKRNFSRAALLKVITPSPQRQDPFCPYFGECGGCQLQHMNCETQRREKLRMIQSAFHYHGKIDPPDGIHLIGDELPDRAYRSRISLQVDRQGKVGFFRRGTHSVIEVASCAIASPLLSKALSGLSALPPSTRRSLQSIRLEEHNHAVFASLALCNQCSKGQFQALKKELPGQLTKIGIDSASFRWRKQKISVTRRSEKGKSPVGHFSQVNPFANALLVPLVQQYVLTSEVFDLFCGAGNFSLELARAKKSVTAVDSDAALIEAGKLLKMNLPDPNRLSFVHSSCEDFIQRTPLHGTVVLDPPRAGAQKIVTTLQPAQVSRILYVSCNVSTLIRDLKLLKASGYHTQKVFFVDMFPQTHHVELLAVVDSID